MHHDGGIIRQFLLFSVSQIVFNCDGRGGGGDGAGGATGPGIKVPIYQGYAKAKHHAKAVCPCDLVLIITTVFSGRLGCAHFRDKNTEAHTH